MIAPYIYPITLLWVECDLSFFKSNKTVLNSGLPLSLIGCRTKIKEPSLSYYIVQAGKKTDKSRPFLKAFT